MFLRYLVTVTIAVAALASAGTVPSLIDEGAVIKRATATSTTSTSSSTSVPDAACSNGPLTRGCWGGGYSIATDYDNKWPSTGVTVSYDLTITNTTMAPDGNPRLVFAVNGQFPGPTIKASWGDTLSIKVTNNLQDNGTSIHWHGIRQANSSHMDGTNGITECPLAPGQSKTYTFHCTQFGTSWYHSHYSAQYGNGILGPIQIDGPATSNYDFDLGPMMIQDWYYNTADNEAILAAVSRGPPVADNALINGKMKNASGGGSYSNFTMQKGKKYRMRFINSAVDNHFKLHMDNHTMQVITTDFVPIVPYTADWVFLGIGQRMDVIVTANQPIENYWFRAEVQPQCGANANNGNVPGQGNIRAIFSYAGANATEPTTTGTTYIQGCADETQLVPFVKKNVPQDLFLPQAQALDIGFARVASNGQNVVTWPINGTAMSVDWEMPTLQYVMEGNTSYPPNLNVIKLDKKNDWSFWIMQSVPQNVAQVPHPIHLHGHDFYLMGSGSGVFNATTMGPALNYTNPPRKDVAMLPGAQGGAWLVIGFFTDNPGAWLMHCHIAWHVGEGLAVQFVERAADIPSTLNIPPSFNQTCAQWDAWYATAPYLMDDSGL